MKSIATVKTLKGKRVLIRVDYNVPIKRGSIVDARRIESSYQTIDAVLNAGGTPILLAHLGKGEDSLAPVARLVGKRYKVLFLTTDATKAVTQEAIAHAKQGTVILLENIRRYPGEEKNTASFANALAKLGDVYVNDAFSVSHRAHASVVGIAKLLPSYAGFQLLSEVTALSSVLKSKAHPFLFILGGAKFATKIPLVERFSEKADHLVIAGAILNTFYAIAGFPIGASVTEPGFEKPIKALLKNPKLLLPTDVVVLRGRKKLVLSPNEVEAKDVIVDIGPRSAELIAEKVRKAKLVVWNGPAGWYEKGFDAATIAIATACTETTGQVIVGGGDTAAAVEAKLRSPKKNLFISTGGGAALEFLSKGTLPGITALS